MEDICSEKILIHIGKCGGSSVRESLNQDSIEIDTIIHIKKPPISKNFDYYFTVRAPISRALSAFNWRRHLVIDKRIQENRFPNEKEVLIRYETLNELAVALYDDGGNINNYAQDHFNAIHHLRESIAFYLLPLIDCIDAHQIRGVCAQESLADDFRRVFGSPLVNARRNHNPVDPMRSGLCDRAKKNLLLFLRDDFRCLDRLKDLGKLSPACIDAVEREKALA